MMASFSKLTKMAPIDLTKKDSYLESFLYVMLKENGGIYIYGIYSWGHNFYGWRNYFNNLKEQRIKINN